MKNQLIFAIAAVFFAVATVFNMNMMQANDAGDVSVESIIVMAQAFELIVRQHPSHGNGGGSGSESEYRNGFPGTNWKSYSVDCTVTNNGTRIIHLPIIGSLGYETGKSTTANFKGTKCGFGTGWCLTSDC